MTRTLLIDGDIVAYKTAAALEVPINWGDDEEVGVDLWTLHSSESECKQVIKDTVDNLMDVYEGDSAIIALTSPNNFRNKILEDYKANRKDTRKPVCLPAMRKFFLDKYETFLRPGLEADDVIGILNTSDKIVKGETVAISSDKDFKSFPGLHGHLDNFEDGIVEISEAEADYWHLHQTLTGDSTDNYKGCPGVGPGKADKILAPFFDEDAQDFDLVGAWSQVWMNFAKAKLSSEVALQQARVARILRSCDYDFKNKKPILWEPPATGEEELPK